MKLKKNFVYFKGIIYDVTSSSDAIENHKNIAAFKNTSCNQNIIFYKTFD